MNSADHPIWKIATLVVVGVILILMLKYNYANGWAPADWATLITVLLGVGGVQLGPSVASYFKKIPPL